MSRMRPRVLGWVIVALVLGIGATSLGSQPLRGNPDPAQLRLLQSVAALELRVHGLEARVRLLEQRNREEQLGDVSAVNTLLPREAPHAAFRCDDPTELDERRGVRRFRAECLSTGAPGPCDPPFAFDELGIKRVNPTCSTGR